MATLALVRINITRLANNLSPQAGRKVTRGEAERWLVELGFTRTGSHWVVTTDIFGSLPEELVRCVLRSFSYSSCGH